MAIVEEFPALTKSEPISFGTLCPRKTRAASLFTLADTPQLRNDSILSSNPAKKKRPRKQQKKLSSIHDDGSQVHSADELAHAFLKATDNSLRNTRDVQFGSVASIWRQDSIVENPTRATVHSPIGSVPRAAEDEGFVDGLTEPSSAASLHNDLRLSEDASHCFNAGDRLPSLSGLGDSCPTALGGHVAKTTKLTTNLPSDMTALPSVNPFDSGHRSRQDSSSENNSVVFGSPDLPRLWDSSGQETIKHNPVCRKELNHAFEATASTTNFGSIYASRDMCAMLSQERGGTGAVGDVDEDDLEGNDLLHLISNSLDRFNEIVHPHELNPGSKDDGLVLSVDSTELCSSGYGSFDQQPQQLFLQSGKFSLGELKSAVEEESNTNILPWLASSGTSRPNHGTASQPARPYFLAGDCDSSSKYTCTHLFPAADSATPCTNAGSFNSGGSSKAISPALFPNGSPSLYPNHISGNMGVASDGTMAPGDNCPAISSADSGSVSMLRHFCSTMSAPNSSGPSKTNEPVSEVTSHANPKPSVAEWCELVVHAVRALQEGGSRSTQLKEAILASTEHDEISKNGLDTILNGLGLLALNEAANTTAQWNQKNKASVTTPLDGLCSHRTVQSTTMPPSTLLGDDKFSAFNRTHRTTLAQADLDQFGNQQQSKRTAVDLCGRRSVLSACFPTNGSGSWESPATDVKLSSGGSCSGSNGCLSASFFDGYNQLSAEHTPARNATPFGSNHQSGRGPHRATRRPNALSCSGNLNSHSASPGASLADPPLSYLLSNSNQTAPLPLGSSIQFNNSRHGTSTKPFLLESKSSNRPIVFHLQEFLRHDNNGCQKRMQCDHTTRFSNGGTNARGACSPSGHSAKTTSSSSGSSNSSTCGSANPEHQDAGGKPVIAKWRRACSFYLRGHCKKEDCEFAHDLTKVTCKFWEMGECFKGPTCPFLHGYPPELLSSQEQ